MDGDVVGRYKVVEPPDGQWGIADDKDEWNGMIRQILNKVGIPSNIMRLMLNSTTVYTSIRLIATDEGTTNYIPAMICLFFSQSI